LFPVLFEAAFSAALNNEGDIESEPEKIRKDNYYIAVEMYSDIEKDCLSA